LKRKPLVELENLLIDGRIVRVCQLRLGNQNGFGLHLDLGLWTEDCAEQTDYFHKLDFIND